MLCMDKNQPVPERHIPIHVPAGWAPDRWASFCHHMTYSCREIRPQISKEWGQAAAMAEHVHKSSIVT